ncbi:MAG TPA: hypothetical protein VG269_02230 [Tepidisphaeraceae bacterium]|nr:hypothetical protein [Tepidisphaeraceae bacterium]
MNLIIHLSKSFSSQLQATKIRQTRVSQPTKIGGGLIRVRNGHFYIQIRLFSVGWLSTSDPSGRGWH